MTLRTSLPSLAVSHHRCRSGNARHDKVKQQQYESNAIRREAKEIEAFEIEHARLEKKLAEMEEQAGYRVGVEVSDKEKEAKKLELKAMRYELKHLEEAISDASRANLDLTNSLANASNTLADATKHAPPAPTVTPTTSSSQASPAALAVLKFKLQKTELQLMHLMGQRDAVVDAISLVEARHAQLQAGQRQHAVDVAAAKAAPPVTHPDLQARREELKQLTWKRAKLESTVRQQESVLAEVDAAREAVRAKEATVAEAANQVSELRVKLEGDRDNLEGMRDELNEGVRPVAEKLEQTEESLALQQVELAKRGELKAALIKAQKTLAAAAKQDKGELVRAVARAGKAEDQVARAQANCDALRNKQDDSAKQHREDLALIKADKESMQALQRDINNATVRRAQLQSEGAQLSSQIPIGVDKQLKAARIDVASLEAEVTRRTEAEARSVWGVARDGVEDKMFEVGLEVLLAVKEAGPGWLWSRVRELEDRIAAEQDGAAKRAATRAAERVTAARIKAEARPAPILSMSAEERAARSQAQAKQLAWTVAQLQDMLDESREAVSKQRRRNADLTVRLLTERLVV